MPKSWRDFVRGATGAAAGLVGIEVIARITGADMPTWTLILIALVLGLVSVFLEQLERWLCRLYRTKKLKYLIGTILVVVLVTWLGWPWPRMQNFIAEVKIKQPVISDNWMSEKEAEQFIIEKLQENSDREVFLKRVRWLLRTRLEKHTMGMFICEGDSAWRPLYRREVRAVLSLDTYDGSKRLSEFMGCNIQYSIERIYGTDWVTLDKTIRETPIITK